MTRLGRFLTTLFSCLKFFHLLHRRLLIILAGAVFFYDSVGITKALKFLEGTLNSEAISDIDADFVFVIFFLVGQWNLSKSCC